MDKEARYVLESKEKPCHYALGNNALTPDIGKAIKYEKWEAEFYALIYSEFTAQPLGPR